MSEFRVILRPHPEIEKIKTICPFSMKVCLNDLFKIVSPGGLPPSICSQIQKCLKLIRAEGSAFFKSEISDAKLGHCPQIFPFLNYDASPKGRVSILENLNTTLPTTLTVH